MLRRAELAGRKAAQLVARGDVELLKDLAQVVLHRSMADEELCADLWVGETIPGQSGDLCFLGCQHDAGVVGAPEHGLTRGPELATGTLGERLSTNVAKRVVGCAKLVTRIHPPARPA